MQQGLCSERIKEKLEGKSGGSFQKPLGKTEGLGQPWRRVREGSWLGVDEGGVNSEEDVGEDWSVTATGLEGHPLCGVKLGVCLSHCPLRDPDFSSFLCSLIGTCL